MQRALQNRKATITASFVESSPIPDEAKVKVTNSAGETLVAETAASGSKGEFTYVLSPTVTAKLDRLTAVWKAGEESQTTYCDVAGGHVVSLAEIEGDLPTGLHPIASELAVARILAEEALEDACYVSFVPRYRRQVNDDGCLERGRVRVLREVKVNGTAVSNISGLRVVNRRYLPLQQFFSTFYGDSTLIFPTNLSPQVVEVAYEHGWDEPPPLVGRAVLRLARYFLTEDPSDYDARATAISTEEAHYALVTPGVSGAIFALPEVNAVVQRYGMGPG